MSVFSPTGFRDLVSGRQSGLTAATLRLVLRIAEVPYAALMRLRNGAYDRGWKPSHQVGVPVVSIGNLTLGGTGKTPLVEFLAKWFSRQQIPVALISRGYGTSDGRTNDEALELQRRLPDVPHLQNPDRVAAAGQALEQTDCRALMLDDAFQHRRIHRDLDIVLLDALEPFGFDHVFPRGTLREPPSGLRRADCVLLARADLLDDAARGEIRRHIACLAPQALWGEVRHAPARLVSASGSEAPLESLSHARVAAFCGIGNPAGFRHTLRGCGYDIARFQEFADHHDYSDADATDLIRWAEEGRVDAVLCTRKDLVKLNRDHLGDTPLWAVEIELEFLAGWKALESRLQSLCSPE